MKAPLALLVGVQCPSEGPELWRISDTLDELAELARTAGLSVYQKIYQTRSAPHRKTYVGKGKIEEIAALIESKNIEIVVTDDELSPVQTKSLESLLKVKILDRTRLILDIFSQHAHTAEAKLQVELAQLDYLRPRLTRLWTHLSRLGGGIGTRGPGEKQLESDKRQIDHRITFIKRKLEKVSHNRSLRRKNRKELPVPTGTLIGYTNAGKSTILNLLTNAEVLAENKLFATLDPTSRRFQLPNQDLSVLTDTVGFIQNLPHHLVKAFFSTLEEVTLSDYLIHVIDASHPNLEGMLNTTMSLIPKLKAEQLPMLYVFNKKDQVTKPNAVKAIMQDYTPHIFISAQNKTASVSLKKGIMALLERAQKEHSFRIPYNRMDIMDLLHKHGKTIHINYTDTQIQVKTKMNPITAAKILSQLNPKK